MGSYIRIARCLSAVAELLVNNDSRIKTLAWRPGASESRLLIELWHYISFIVIVVILTELDQLKFDIQLLLYLPQVVII